MVIWKFPLRLAAEQNVIMPAGAEILCVQIQGTSPTVWARCLEYGPKAMRRVSIVGTGQPFSPCHLAKPDYVGTVQQNGFVWHIFDGGEADLEGGD